MVHCTTRQQENKTLYSLGSSLGKPNISWEGGGKKEFLILLTADAG